MSLTYLEAIRAAQARALAEDSRVFIYGQDVGSFGGAFKATKNLAQEYPGRVIDSPISEDAMVGAAIGADHRVFADGRVDDAAGVFLGEVLGRFERAAEAAHVLAVDEHARIFRKRAGLGGADGF